MFLLHSQDTYYAYTERSTQNRSVRTEKSRKWAGYKWNALQYTIREAEGRDTEMKLKASTLNVLN